MPYVMQDPVPDQGRNSMPPAVEAWSPNPWMGFFSLCSSWLVIVFPTFLCFGDQEDLKSTSGRFWRTLFYWNLSNVLFMTRLELHAFETKTREMKCHFYLIISKYLLSDLSAVMLTFITRFRWYLLFLWCKSFLPSPAWHTTVFGRKSIHAAHIYSHPLFKGRVSA